MAILGDKNIKELKGVVVGTKNNKTVKVEVETVKLHKLYNKRTRTQKVYHAHDEENKANEGDTVIIRQCRPLSKLKKWKLVSIERIAEVM